MADVFLSYAKADRALAQKAVLGLEAVGFSVWWDDRLTPNESWDRLIEQEIANAKAVVVLWTRNSVASDWVRIEATFGKDNHKLVQARFDDTPPPLAFTLLQRAELADWNPDEAHGGWDKLIEWTAHISGVQPVSRPSIEPTGSSKNTGYWDAFHAAAEAKGVRRPMLSPVRGANYYFYLSKKPEISVASFISRAQGGAIGVYLAIWLGPAQQIFEALKQQRIDIEREAGSILEWRQTAPTTFWVMFPQLAANPDDARDWSRQHAWLAERMATLKSVIAPRLPAILNNLAATP